MRHALSFTLLLGAFSINLVLGAEPVPVPYGGEGYQQTLLNSARAHDRLEIERSPEGKRIERIVISTFPVVVPQEPYPDFLNFFHVTTKTNVVQRELLFHEGDAWSQEQVDETARNLRNYLFLTSAQIVPCHGSRSDSVVALVVTKDLWSLRLNTSFSYVGAKLEHLDFQISEHNFAGEMKRTTIDLGMDLATYYLGEQYHDPRLFGSELLLAQRTDLIVNRASGHLEGGVTSLSIEQPLYTLDTPWGWNASASYRKDIYRLFSGGDIALVTSPTTGEILPYLFNRELLDLKTGFTRSLGHLHKQDLSLGYRAFIHRFGIPDPGPLIQPATVTDFVSATLPRSESAGMLYVAYHSYQADFRELLNIQTFALTEDYRLGPDISGELRWANRGFGFDSAFIEPLLSIDDSWLAADDLFSVGASADIRYQPEAVPGSYWGDGQFDLHTRNVSPRWGFIRLNSVLHLLRRYNDLDHSFSTLGGDTSLRGFPSAYLRGANLWGANLEVRTLPAVLATLHIGLVAFLDLGGAADSLDQLGVHASAGAGIRIGIPQFNRPVLRVDFGVPLESIVGGTPAYIVAQYGQAF